MPSQVAMQCGGWILWGAIVAQPAARQWLLPKGVFRALGAVMQDIPPIICAHAGWDGDIAKDTFCQRCLLNLSGLSFKTSPNMSGTGKWQTTPFAKRHVLSFAEWPWETSTRKCAIMPVGTEKWQETLVAKRCLLSYSGMSCEKCPKNDTIMLLAGGREHGKRHLLPKGVF